jgi:formylglycine-generating enzyme required for sulfatase activity
VDKIKGDKSELGVIGMAGNLSEWTATWTPDNRFPIVKGGSFMTPDARLDAPRHWARPE